MLGEIAGLRLLYSHSREKEDKRYFLPMSELSADVTKRACKVELDTGSTGVRLLKTGLWLRPDQGFFCSRRWAALVFAVMMYVIS